MFCLTIRTAATNMPICVNLKIQLFQFKIKIEIEIKVLLLFNFNSTWQVTRRSHSSSSPCVRCSSLLSHWIWVLICPWTALRLFVVGNNFRCCCCCCCSLLFWISNSILIWDLVCSLLPWFGFRFSFSFFLFFCFFVFNLFSHQTGPGFYQKKNRNMPVRILI